MLLTSNDLSSDRYWAVYLTIAEFMPQSRNTPMRVGVISTIAYRPYRSDPSSLAMKIVAIAEITVEITKPHSSWKLPFVVTLAISAALLIFFLSRPYFVCMFV